MDSRFRESLSLFITNKSIIIKGFLLIGNTYILQTVGGGT